MLVVRGQVVQASVDEYQVPALRVGREPAIQAVKLIICKDLISK